MNRIQFTRAQAHAVQHRLDNWTPNSPGHVRACELAWELQTRYAADVHTAPGPNRDLDEHILREAIEGSKWLESQQYHANAARALWNAWVLIAAEFNVHPSTINFPQT